MLLLVGLGNPGARYSRNRHNIGFLALDEIVRRHDFAPWRSRFQGQAAEGRIGGHRVLALKPQTYMNESGRAVGEAVRFFKLEPAQIIVLHDEIDLRPGRVRVKRGGGAAGHNGLRSLDAHIGRDYWRVRLGVGHPGEKDQVHGHVLHDFGKTDQAWLEPLLEALAGELPALLEGDESAFMSRVAQRVGPHLPKPPPAEPEASDGAGPGQADDGDRDGL